MEEVRKKKYSNYPSRMACLYVSKTFEEADSWAKFFAKIGRPTYHIEDTLKKDLRSSNVYEALKCTDKNTNITFS